MALTDAQQELLHAFVDGETTPAESQIAQQLLARHAAARAYMEELKRLRQLLLTHGCVNAPEDLHRRVCAALDKDFNAPPVITLPRMAWRSALYAAAAVVVVSLALVFGPQLNQPGDQPTDGIAQTPGASGMNADDAKHAEDAGPETRAGGEWTPAEHPVHAHSDSNEEDGIREADKPAPPLLLDRGVGQPLEISLHFTRGRKARALQVYNDILVVSSLYGEARLHDSDHELEEFSGRDFSTYDGVEVELESRQVPALLVALDLMNDDQDYGRFIVPSDLRRLISESAQASEELQRLNLKTDKSGNQDLGARAYLPPEVQREMLRRHPEDAHTGVSALGKTRRGPEAGGGGTDAAQGESRKIKLFIKLR
jgi:hypothetical protein